MLRRNLKNSRNTERFSRDFRLGFEEEIGLFFSAVRCSTWNSLPPCFESLDFSLPKLFRESEAHIVCVVMFVLACCTNICIRISAAINRAMTTLPRSAKTLRDIPRRYSVKISARHGLINLELKTLKFLIFGAKGGLLKITPRHKSELVVTHTCTDSIFIDFVKYFPYLSCLWSRQQVETCPRRK